MPMTLCSDQPESNIGHARAARRGLPFRSGRGVGSADLAALERLRRADGRWCASARPVLVAAVSSSSAMPFLNALMPGKKVAHQLGQLATAEQ